MKIWYAKHPISKDRVRELNSEGYRVVDARFSPDGKETQEEKPKPKRKAKA